MTMPGGPSAPMGAEGQIDVPGPIIEPAEPLADRAEDGDDRIPIPVGQQEHGPESPAHGAAGGHDVDFNSVAPDLHTDTTTTTGMTTGHPAFGRSSK